MFTGIIEERGEVLAWNPSGDAARITVRAPLAVSDAGHGDSISVSGVCLTVIDQGDDWFTADVMASSLAVTTLGERQPGDLVNIERGTPAGGRLGGHVVQGHVDGSTHVISLDDGSAWRVVRFALPSELAPLVARKGSITIDGTSLTVSAVSEASEPEQWFEVSLIPETLTATTHGALTPGDRVNVETDILARHVERMLKMGATS